MNTQNNTTDEQVSCEICLKEIPASEAQNAEASDYVAYFCGLDCYDKWSHQETDTTKK